MNGAFAWILALLLLCVPAVATETTGEETPAEDPPVEETMTTETEVEGSNITVNVTVPTQAASAEDPASEEEAEDPLPAAYSVTSLDDETPAEEGAAVTLTDTIESLFGPYTPRTQTVTDYLSDGTVVESQEIVPGLAGLDYPWIAAVSMFSLVMFCFFKLLGGLLK